MLLPGSIHPRLDRLERRIDPKLSAPPYPSRDAVVDEATCERALEWADTQLRAAIAGEITGNDLEIDLIDAWLRALIEERERGEA